MTALPCVAMPAGRFRLLGALLFLVHGVPAPPLLPMTHKLLPPHLFSLNSGKIVRMDQDIASFLKAVPCQSDLVLQFLYQDTARAFFQNTLTDQDYRIYNGNIYLLTLINRLSFTGKMCRNGVIKDLTSTKFCTDLAMEEYFENDFIESLRTILTGIGFFQVIEYAEDLESIKTAEECNKKCGGRYPSSLCRMFIALSHFLVEEFKSYTCKWIVSV